MNEEAHCLIWDTPAIDKSKGGHDVSIDGFASCGRQVLHYSISY